MLTQARLKELLTYDRDTGEFRWKIDCRGVKSGDIAGCANDRGYIQVQLDGKKYAAHRLAFLYMEGAFPPAAVDHINGVPGDNRWCNLRPATLSQNQANAKMRKNNTTGVKGVCIAGRKFCAQIQAEGKRVYLGTFDTIAEASAAYERAANDLHGEFARTA